MTQAEPSAQWGIPIPVVSFLMAFRSADISPKQQANSVTNLARAAVALRARAGATLKRKLPDADAFPPLEPLADDAEELKQLEPLTGTEVEKCPGNVFQRPHAVPSRDDMDATARRHQLSPAHRARLNASRHYPVSITHGPLGTGKTRGAIALAEM